MGRILLLVLACAYVLGVARNQVLTGDPTYYIGLAQSLLGGHGYTIAGVPHTAYPPGLPLLLLLPLSLPGPSVLVAQLLVASFAPLSLLAVLAWLRKHTPAASLPISALTVGSFAFFSLATLGVNSELPYLAVTATALVLAARHQDQPGWCVAAVVALAVLAVMLRTIGVALPLAFLAAWIHRRMRRVARNSTDTLLLAGGTAGLIAIAAWFAWGAVHPPSEENYLRLLLLEDPHVPDLGAVSPWEVISRMPRALLMQVAHLGELLTGLSWILPSWFSPLVVVPALAMVVGLWRELQRENPVVGWYLLGYGGILLIWPFDEGVRFLLPVLPMALAVGWNGAVHTIRSSGTPSTWRLAGAACLLPAAMAAAGAGGFPAGSRQGAAIVAVWVLGAVCCVVLSWDAVRRLVSRRVPLLVVLYLLVNVALNARRIVPTALANLRGVDGSTHAALRPALEWLNRNTEPDDVVMAAPPFNSAVRFYTSRRTATLPSTADTARLRLALSSTAPHYLLIVDASQSPYYLPTEQERLSLLRTLADPPQLAEVYRQGVGVVYRVR